jgi:16S rRNA (cytidine1402-2'-O)-methyltransferase
MSTRVPGTVITSTAAAGRLVVIATPIGNLGDLSPRAAEALRGADVVACEDTRRTATLLRHCDADTPMIAVHTHNEAARAQQIVERLSRGEVVALVSDAGMPLVSDPGQRVVEAVREAGLLVEVIPGPSAVTAALALAGFPADRFLFVGFFPRKATERTELIASIDRLGVTVVGFESPNRIAGLLAHLAKDAPDRRACVGRELTKMHEEAIHGTLGELAERLVGPARGEVTLVLAPVATAAPDGADVTRAVEILLTAGLSPARAADAAHALGLGARNAAYAAALAARNRDDR